MEKILNSLIGVSIIILVGTCFSTKAQSFTNLDFESATVAPSALESYPNFVPIGSALPGWTAFLGTEQVTQVGYNAPANSTASITLIGPTWNGPDVGTYGVGIIDGNYSVDLQTGANPLNPTPLTVNASIEQNGNVPSTAESLLFEAREITPITVSFDGNVLATVALYPERVPTGCLILYTVRTFRHGLA